MVRFCPNCGTEVDDSAVFCPTCGQAIDQDAEIDMPPAPAWPEPSPRAADAPVEMEPVAPEPAAAEDEPPLEPAWETIPRRPPEAGPAAAGAASGQVDTPTAVTDRPSDAASPNDAGSGLDLPFTMPVMLSGWLIGGGSLVGGARGAGKSLQRLGQPGRAPPPRRAGRCRRHGLPIGILPDLPSPSPCDDRDRACRIRRRARSSEPRRGGHRRAAPAAGHGRGCDGRDHPRDRSRSADGHIGRLTP